MASRRAVHAAVAGASSREHTCRAGEIEPKPRDFTKALFALASTENAVPSDEDLLGTVVNGIPSAAMPPQSFLPRGPQRLAVRSVRNLTRLGKRQEVLGTAREMLERFEAHLRAVDHYTIIANMRGESPEELAQKLFAQPSLGGLQGPTISRVYLRDVTDTNWYAITIVVRKEGLHGAIDQLRAIGGSGVLVMPVTYIFEEAPPRWRKLLQNLGLDT